MSRQECLECKVQTTEFGCRNCGSTKLRALTLPPVAQPQRPLLEISHAIRARREMQTT